MSVKSMIGQASIFTLLTFAGGITVAVTSGVFAAMNYTNNAVKAAVAPVAEQSQEDHDALLKQTALMVVIAQKVGVPQSEVNQLLNK